MSGETKSNDLVFLGGLWLAQDKNGNGYMSGSLGIAGKVLIFKNTGKKSENDPDYLLYVAGRERQQTGNGETDMKDIPF